MPPTWRAVATDLDGTIVRADGSITAATMAAIEALDTAGIAVVVATARTLHGLSALPGLATGVSAWICCNGAVGYHPRSRASFWQHEIPAAVLDPILTTVKGEFPDAGIGLYTGERWLLTANYAVIRGKKPHGPVDVTDRLTGRAALALGVCHPTLTSAELSALLHAIPDVESKVTVSYGADDILDITPAGIDKGTGLRDALGQLQIDAADCVAFGDALNDVPMFRIAGHSVAVANAHPAAVAAATTTTSTVDRDGFHAALHSLGLIPAQA